MASDEVTLTVEARRWLIDAGYYWASEVNGMPAGILRVRVDRLYEGGWEAFERDNKALLSE